MLWRPTSSTRTYTLRSYTNTFRAPRPRLRQHLRHPRAVLADLLRTAQVRIAALPRTAVEPGAGAERRRPPPPARARLRRRQRHDGRGAVALRRVASGRSRHLRGRGSRDRPPPPSHLPRLLRPPRDRARPLLQLISRQHTVPLTNTTIRATDPQHHHSHLPPT